MCCLFCFWKKCLVSTFPFPPHAFEFSKVGLHTYTALWSGMVINPFHRDQISLAAIICHSSRILSGQPEFSIPPATSISDAKEWTGDDWVYRSSAGVGTMGTMRDDPVTSKTAVKAGARIGLLAEIFWPSQPVLGPEGFSLKTHGNLTPLWHSW